MADAILLERSGLPAATICTDAFRVAAEAMARNYGFPGFQFVVTEHPVASLTVDQLRDRVAQMTPRILEILGVEG